MISTIDRTTPPEPKEIGSIRIQEAEKSSLDNGINVYSVNAGFQDLVKIEVIFNNSAFDVLQPIAASSTNRMLSDGSSAHNAMQLSEMIDYFGAFYETEETADDCSVVLFTLNKYLDATLEVLREII